MIAGPGGPTRVLHGLGRLSDLLTGRPGRRVGLLVDEGVAESETVRRVRDRFERARSRIELTVLAGPGDLGAVMESAHQLGGSEIVVGVGGGSLLDRVKLATLVCSASDVAQRIAVPQRSGLVVLPPGRARTVPLITVPTTVGTGAEVSAVACLTSASGKRLVMGAGLRPECALLDPVATRSLPSELVAEGVLEALFRVASPYIGDDHDLPTEDALTETVAEQLVRLGNTVRDDRLAGRAIGDEVRLEAAKLSGHTHAEWLHLGRDAYAVKGWLIANELSTAVGVRKMTAVAALLPHLWRSIAEGDARWGSAPRLHRLWGRLRGIGSRPLPADPALGMTALLDSWRIERRINLDAERLDALARHTVHAWGAGLPMLGRLTVDEVRGLLAKASAHRPRPAHDRQ
ncbi:daptide-type RiPP biosynthesis dehydogenase [Streptomyces paromomycinus]|uniref:Aldehyde-alcohol dehydrogenase n=1 Tax=Streptomyces paromomycinus TaxID=92743 RepID=A0A401W611_STREY|nr:daptide-type RiPP biosynthesis dehydogenase [Streptomyces paromomycinus]GCD44719.1 aldehyde-alcohol dehydrogenase [Streptomyces paromomycinus]